MLKYTIEVIGWLAAALMLSAYLLLSMGYSEGPGPCSKVS
jgi:hypothetical protein